MKNFTFFLLFWILVSNLPCFALCEELKTFNANIDDEFATKSFPEKICIPVYIETTYSDNLIDENFIRKYSVQNNQEVSAIEDFYAETNLSEYKNTKYKRKIYNFENLNHVAVKIKSKQRISTRITKNEGENFEFVNLFDVFKNDKLIIPKNAVIIGRIETVSPNLSNGIPANLIVGSFKYQDVELVGQISKVGANRFYWVKPLGFVSGMFTFGLGYLFYAVRGGHAKITKNQIFEIYLPNNL